jgi:ribonuclease P protein component
VLERPHRLTTSAGFTVATRRGRRAAGRALVLHLASTRSPAEATREGGANVQVGFVVGRSVGNAVMRNRVRRQLRHLVRQRLGSLPDAALLVVRALPSAAGLSSRALGHDLDTALARLGVSGPSATRAVDSQTGTLR